MPGLGPSASRLRLLLGVYRASRVLVGGGLFKRVFRVLGFKGSGLGF